MQQVFWKEGDGHTMEFPPDGIEEIFHPEELISTFVG